MPASWKQAHNDDDWNTEHIGVRFFTSISDTDVMKGFFIDHDNI